MTLRLGLMFSTTGSYAALGQSALAGALGAIEALGRRGGPAIAPVVADPGGDIAAYDRIARGLLDSGVRHIVGAITSSSRKELIPLLERYGALLWYPCPYEGFESNDHVVYLGASPNHHVVPVADWIAARGLRRVYLAGSNYVWGWETLRLARECLAARGIEIVGERYVPLGAATPDHIIGEIADRGADCVVDSLIGPSNVSLLRGLAARRQAGGDPVQVVSFNQTEADLDEIGAAADGLLAAGSFFEPDAGDDLRAVARQHAPNGRVSSFMATTHAAVEILVAATQAAGTDDPAAVFRAATAAPVPTVMGDIVLDPVLRHAVLMPRLAIADGGRFRIVQRAAAPIPADPYMTGQPAAPRAALPAAAPNLRIVS